MKPSKAKARALAGAACLLIALLLVACPQTSPEQASAETTAGQQADAASAEAPASQQTRAATEHTPVSQAAKPAPPKVRTGGPLPPQLMPEPVKLDRSCRTDADCAVKDVGSCCGAYPACVNRNSPADPAAVQAECARQGKSSTCGFREISDCQCVRGSCVAGVQAIDPSIDPAPQPLEER